MLLVAEVQGLDGESRRSQPLAFPGSEGREGREVRGGREGKDMTAPFSNNIQ